MSRKGNKGRILLLIILGVLALSILGLALSPLGGDTMPAMETLQSAEAQMGSISTTVTGSGNLSLERGQDILIPAGLTVDEVLVQTGDRVAAGDVLATFDAFSIQARIAHVQGELDRLDRAIQALQGELEPTTISTQVSGRVKAIFGEVGDTVTTTVLAYDALMLLSLDGRMAVTVGGEIPLAGGGWLDRVHMGEAVTVSLGDGTEHRGTVERVTTEDFTVTLTDNGPGFGDMATIFDADGNTLGRGALYINQPLAVIGTSGTIGRVHVTENARVNAGATLFTLTEVAPSSEYLGLIRQRQEQTDIFRSLLTLSQTGALRAEFDGVVERISIGDGADTGLSPGRGGTPQIPPGMWPGMMRDENSAGIGASSLANRSGGGLSLSLLSNQDGENSPTDSTGEPPPPTPPPTPLPTPEPTPLPTPPPARQEITSISDLNLAAPAAGAAPQTTVQGQGYTGMVQWMPKGPVFLPGTVYYAGVMLTPNSGYVFSPAILEELAAGFPSPGATVLSADFIGPALLITLVYPPTEGAGGFPPFPPDFEFPSFEMPSFNFPSINMGGFDVGGFGGMEGMEGQMSQPGEVPAFTIAAGGEMRLVVTVDELDILSLQVGQGVWITLDALPEERFPGEVTRVNTGGGADWGDARYSVEITLPRREEMLPGMTASAVITIMEVRDILVIPAEAVQENGDSVYVYTQSDGGAPTSPQEVVTGRSDGIYVEILQGLSAGDRVYYMVPEVWRWPHFGMGPGGGGNWGN